MNRRPLLALLATTALVLLSIAGSGHATAQPSPGVADAAIIGTNSVDLDRNVTVTGDVVVNAASAGPTLDGGVELNVDKVITQGLRTAEGELKADSVALNKFAAISGTVFYNELFDAGATVGGLFTPLPLPVFAQLPAFQIAMVNPAAPDVVLGFGEAASLDEGDWGDIDVGAGATLTLTGGVYNVRSITVGQDANLFFEDGADIRIVGRLATGKFSTVGAAPGATVFPSQVILYVGGINGTGGGLLEPPLAAGIGRESTFNANVYAAQGTISIGRLTLATGGFIARDVWVQTGASVVVDSFVNRPPTADPQDVFTADQESIDIVLTGSDPNGDPLSFSIATLSTTGVLTDSNNDPVVVGATLPTTTVTFTPDDPSANLEDSFDFTVTDPGLLTDTATVQINPAGDPVVQCTQNSDCDPGQFCNTGAGLCELGEVVATDRLCASAVAPIDCSLETIEETAIIIRLRGTAPCDPTGAPNPAEPCDGIGNDVPLTFALPSSATSQGGTVTGLVQGTGTPRRSATVLYTPPVGFTGVDSFSFDVSGDVDNSGGIDPSAEPNPEIDSGSIEISVQTFTPPPPVEARDQMVSTPINTPVNIALSGGAGSCDPLDPDCRTGTPLTAPSAAGPSGPAPVAGVTLALDDTGSPADGSKSLGLSQRVVKPGPVNRVAAPGEDLFAIDSDLDQLFKLSPADATSTLVGSTAAGPTTPASLAFDGVDMYTIDLGGGGLYRLNLNTGAPTLVCSTGISGWQGVASDPTDEGQFYGITQADDLYKIDRTTCTTTRVNATAGTVGGLIAGLEFDANGTLWGAEFGSPGSTTENAALVTIDKTTGAVTIVSQCATRPCSGSDNFLDGFQGIDFSTDGTLYGQNTNDEGLYIIDTTDGSLTFLGSNSTIFVKGLAFSEEVLLEAGFTILTLPDIGTLSYLSPATGTQTTITSGDLPLLLTTEEVTYTPPTDVTGETSFTFRQSDGLTTDTGTIELVITGAIIIVDPCTAVGRPPGCEAEEAGAGGESSAESSTSTEPLDAVPNLRVVVEGKGTVSSSRRETPAGSFVGLACSDKCGAEFAAGSEVVLYARTLEHSVFVGWGGDCSGSDPVTTVTVSPRATCIAIFESEE